MSKKQEIFEYIFKHNIWGDSDSKSGAGSNLHYTQSIRAFLPDFFEKYKIKSILDAPCGDMFWFSQLNLKKIKYYGYDIVDEMIQNNKEKFAKYKNYKFETADLITDKLPKVDLIFCRDLIIHFPINAVYDLIKNFIKTKSKYLMITQFIVTSEKYSINKDIEFGQFALRSLIEPPFNFPYPQILIPEDWDYKGFMRFMALYELKTLEEFIKNNNI